MRLFPSILARGKLGQRDVIFNFEVVKYMCDLDPCWKRDIQVSSLALRYEDVSCGQEMPFVRTQTAALTISISSVKIIPFIVCMINS